MDKNLMIIDREYVRMETLESGTQVALKKVDYDRILFLTEIYGSSILIPLKEVVDVTPVIQKQNSDFELSPTGNYMIPMRNIKLTVKPVIPE